MRLEGRSLAEEKCAINRISTFKSSSPTEMLTDIRIVHLDPFIIYRHTLCISKSIIHQNLFAQC